MAFLNPFLLFGLGAISIPIIIHLLMNRKIKRVAWAAMRFLQKSLEENKKRIRVEDWLLLLLRCALIIFLALALARPAFHQGGLIGTGGSEMAVILIDNSYSMSQTDGVSSRFDKARKAAEQLLDALPSGSATAIFFVSDGVRAAIPEPTHDLNLARKVIREGVLTDRGSDMLPGVRQALDTLKSRGAARKRVYLITDGQAVGWKHRAEIQQMLEAAKNESPAQVVLIGEKEDRNVGVSDLRLETPIASVDQALRFEIEVTNFGHEASPGVQVGLSIDGAPPVDQAALEAIPPGVAKRVSLYAKLHEAGFHAVTARIPQDHLPADDQRTMAVHVLGDLNVLLVDGNPGAEPRESEVFFLRNAMEPVPEQDRENYFLKTKTVTPSEFESARLNDFEAVVLANVVDFSDTAIAALEKYLRRGGGLIVFPGAKINTDFYNEKLAKQFGFLPARFGSARGNAEQQEAFFHFQDSNYAHPIVSLWNNPAAGKLAGAHFYRVFELKPEQSGREEAGQPAVVLKYADGTPAVMERTWGFGRVIQFSSTAGTAWNDLPVRPAFVPLIQRTLGAILARQNERLNLAAGAKFSYACDADSLGKDATVIKPGGVKGVNSLRRIAAVNGLPRLEFDETDTAGAYDVSIPGYPPLKFAVQADPEESKLDEAPQLDTLSQVARVVRWTPETNLRDAVVQARSGRELWMVFALLALATVCAEAVAAELFSRSK